MGYFKVTVIGFNFIACNLHVLFARRHIFDVYFLPMSSVLLVRCTKIMHLNKIKINKHLLQNVMGFYIVVSSIYN